MPFATKQNKLSIPARWNKFVGGGDSEGIGKGVLQYFIEYCRLEPRDRILDIGCGIGRIAIPLAGYVSDEGRYDGIDIVPDMIHWCKKYISNDHPNFHFHLFDIQNALYNPKGKIDASTFQFPFKDQSFDFIFLLSVFTHLLPNPLEHYFQEIVRLLKPNGRCMITYFLWNKNRDTFLSQERSELLFQYQRNFFRSVNRERPEEAVSYHEDYVFTLYQKYGLSVEQPIHYGSWSGEKNLTCQTYQDIIRATKE